MQNKSFIFWLFNKDKKAVYYDKIVREAVGIFKTNGEPAHLEYSPDGWKDSLVKYGRNIKYLGVFRDFTAPMNFKKDGAKIVKDAMWGKSGMEAILYLAISKLNRTVYPPKYEPWYVGELDFSKIDQKKSNVVLNVMEGGMSRYLKAFENTTYEIPVDADPEAKSVLMDGLPFTNKIEYGVFDGQKIDGNTYMIAIGTVSQEGSTQGILNQDAQFAVSTAYPNDSWFMSNDSKFITVNITGQIKLDVKETGNIIIRIERVNSLLSGPGAVVETIDLFNESKNAGESVVIEVDQSITFEPNERLYLKALPNTSPSAAVWYEIKESSLTVSYEVTFTPSIIKALKPLRLFQKIVEKMTEGRFTARSNFLDSMDDLLITSGSAIRNHEGQAPTASGSVIKTSLDDFFKSMKIRGAGIGIENDVLVLEDTKYFFQNDVVIELGEVSDFNPVVAEDLVFNTIKTGYANQDYDSVNGKDEPNVTQNYTTPHTRIVKELDLTSPYRADAYGIELLRINLDGKDTTDNSSDNDTFMLNVKKGGAYIYYSGNVTFNEHGANMISIPEAFLNTLTGETITLTGANAGTYTVTNTSYLFTGQTVLTLDGVLTDGTENINITAVSDTLYQLNRPAFSSLTGLLHPEKMFNVLLSPKTNLMNNADYIHSVLDFQDLNFIKFQSGDKNSEMSYTLNGVTITEKADVQIGSLPKKLFKPYYFTFKVPTDFNFLKTVAAKPYSKLGFTYNGEKYYGYLVDGGVQPATRDVQQMKLLCAPETNLSQLIDME